MTNDDSLWPALAELEVLALWVLLFTGEEPQKSKMKPNLGPQRLKKLSDLGLLSLEKRSTKSKKTGRNVPAEHVVLTDSAWRWAAENLDAKFSMSINAAVALRGLLPKLKAYLESANVSLAGLLAADPSVREIPRAGQQAYLGNEDIDDRIREAYLSVSGGQFNVRVRLADLRPLLNPFPRNLQDAALLRLQSEERLVLYRNDNPFELLPEDHVAALDLIGEKRHIVYMRG